MDKIYDLVSEVGSLKQTFRFSEVPILQNKDSSAAHSWRLALLTMLVSEKMQFDARHALELAIVHDIAESETGDIDIRLIHDGRITEESKHLGERKVMQKLSRILSNDRLYQLWDEYEHGTTREAKIVKALDKLEGMMTIVEAGIGAVDVPDLLGTYGNKAIRQCPELRGIFSIMKERLKAIFKENHLEWKSEYDDY